MRGFKIRGIKFHGIDLKVFNPQETGVRKRYGIGQQNVIFGVALVWIKDKGLNNFIILSQNPDILVVLVGISDEVKAIS